MAILTPMADERYCNTGVDALERVLDKTLTRVEKYHDGLPKGIEKLKGRIGKDLKDVEFKPVEFSQRESKAVISYCNGRTQEINYDDVADYGNSNV